MRNRWGREAQPLEQSGERQKEKTRGVRANISKRIPHIAIQNLASRQLSCSAGAKLQPSLPSPSFSRSLHPSLPRKTRRRAAGPRRQTCQVIQADRIKEQEVQEGKCVCHNRWWALELKYFILHRLHQIPSCN